MFFTNFIENKISLNKNEDIKDYLNKKTSIKNVACFNQIAKLFNLEKTFCSFYQSNFNDLVKHENFLESDVAIIQKLMQKPFFPRWHLKRGTTGNFTYICLFWENKETATNAVSAWVNSNVKERKKYEEDLLQKNSQFFREIYIIISNVLSYMIIWNIKHEVFK